MKHAHSSKRLLAAIVSAVLTLTCLFSVVAMPASAATIGDITGDGKVNIADSMKLFAAVSGRGTLTADQSAVADITGDGKVNIADAIRLFSATSGRSELPTTTTTTTSTTTTTEPTTTTTTAPQPVEPVFDGINFLQEGYIAEGAENVTINADGTWSVTGNFALAPNVTFDYTVYPYIVQKFSNTAELKITFLDRDPDGVYGDHWIGLYDNWVGPTHYPADSHDRCDSFKGIFDWNIANNGWGNTGNKVTARAIYFEFNGTGTAIFEALYMSKTVPTQPTTTTTTTTTTEATTTTTVRESMGNLVTFSAGSATASVGDTVVIPISVTENHYMVNGQIYVNYDPAVLELQTVWDDEDNPYFEDYNTKIFKNTYMWAFNGDIAGQARFAFASSSSVGTTAGGEMYALTFKVIADAPDGTDVTIEIPEMCSCDGTTNGTEDFNTNYEIVNGKVTVN